MRSFRIEPGTRIADIGTGVGYLLSHLVSAVGLRGKVFAEDIFPDLLEKAKARIRENGWTNVVPILGTEKDPKLPPRSVDLALVVDTYHHFDYPGEMMAGIHSALRPGGRLIVADFYRYRPHPFTSAAVMIAHIRADRDEVIREIQDCGFRLESRFDHFSCEYVLVFRRKP